jgi:signal transduction histidine kinase
VAPDGGSLRIEVWDNGPGFPPGFTANGDSAGYGLRNIAERLRGYYGAAASLAWGRNKGMTRVALSIPCLDGGRSGNPQEPPSFQD